MEHDHLIDVASCPICKGGTSIQVLAVVDHHLTKEGFQLRDCTFCGFRFTSPRPDTRVIGKYYESPNYLSHNTHGTGITSKLYRLARRIAFSRKLALVREYSPGGKLLDFGCGDGGFLHYAKTKGFSISGVEPSANARKQASVSCGTSIASRIEDIVQEGRVNNAITLWHVLEHLDNLNAAIEQIKSCLSETGHLFIAVPNRLSWDAGHYGALWAAWDVPRHLWHFRDKDITRLLSSNGFTVVRKENMWLDAFFIALLSEQYRGRPAWIRWPLALLIGAISNTLAAVSQRPTSSTLYIAKRNSA